MYDSKHGHYYHNNFIGKEFGTKVFDNQNRGYVYILKPTPELWTLALNHRTEILYSADISLIIHHLELRPGSVVLESGTGSGSLSTAIARTIYPNGHLHTYEFHRGRADAAIEDFKRTNLDKLITVRCGDVCSDGFFDVPDESVDAVFLDLPCPWQAVPHAIKKLKPYCRLCSFSPCIEQVQQLCTALSENGFVEITTWECLLRPFDVLDLSEDLQPEEEFDKKKKQESEPRRNRSESRKDRSRRDHNRGQQEHSKKTQSREQKKETRNQKGRGPAQNGRQKEGTRTTTKKQNRKGETKVQAR